MMSLSLMLSNKLNFRLPALFPLAAACHTATLYRILRFTECLSRSTFPNAYTFHRMQCSRRGVKLVRS